MACFLYGIVVAISSFVDSGVSAFASAWGDPFEDLRDCFRLSLVQCVGGKIPPGWWDDVQGSYEGEPIGVEFGRIGCVGHECSDGIVGQQQAPEFLADQFRGFRPKSLSWCEKLSFDLAERHPVFPPLLIRCG